MEGDVSADGGRAGGSDPIAPNVTTTTAIAAAALILLTVAHAVSQRGSETQPPSSREAAYSREAVAAAESDRCALHHARFGGRRAQLIRVMRGSVPNYVVVEVGERDPAMRSLRSNWLKANYGEAERVWLSEYGSAEAAMARAARLCPPVRRCWPGEADCGPPGEASTAAQMFFGRWPPVAPGVPPPQW